MSTGFSIGSHNQFVQDHGELLTYFQGVPCACGTTIDGARSRFVCPLCKGSGTRYEAGKPLRGIVTGITREKVLVEAGILQPGDAILGLAPSEREMVTDWDMVEPSQWGRGQPYSGELVQRGTGATDVLMYKAKQVQSCTSVTPDAFAIIPYVHGVDFTVAGDVVTWLVGRPQPDIESIYSIKYTAIFSYIVFTIPQDRYDKNVSLGQKILIRPRAIALAKRTE